MIKNTILNEITEFSKYELSKDPDIFNSLQFLVRNDDSLKIKVSLKTDDPEDTFFNLGKEMCKEEIKQLVIVINTYVLKAKNKEELIDITNNWDIENPYTYPEKMRQSALFFIAFDLSDKQDGVSGFSVYYSQKEEKIIFEDTAKTKKIDGNLLSYVIAGFTKKLLSELIDFQLSNKRDRAAALKLAALEFKKMAMEDYPLLTTTGLFNSLPDNELVERFIHEETD